MNVCTPSTGIHLGPSRIKALEDIDLELKTHSGKRKIRTEEGVFHQSIINATSRSKMMPSRSDGMNAHIIMRHKEAIITIKHMYFIKRVQNYM